MKTNIIVLLVSILVCLIGLEAGFRLFAPQNLINNEPIYVEDPVVEKRLIPNSKFEFGTTEYRYTVRTNAIGFRDRSHGPAKPDHTKRILVLGDSFTYGPGVEQCKIYLFVLEDLLNRNAQVEHSYEVLAMACGGYGPEHYSAVLRNIGLKYDPDVVILAIYVDNDVTDRLDLKSLSETPPGSFTDTVLYPMNNFLEETSHAFVFLRARLEYPLWKMGLRPYNFPEVFLENVSPDLEREWERTFETLLEIQRLCREAKTSLMTILIPTIFQVQEDIWQKYITVYKIKPEEVDLDFPQKKFAGFLQERNFVYLDLLPTFRKSGIDEPLYFPIDRHWNEAGHELCAQILSENLWIE